MFVYYSELLRSLNWLLFWGVVSETPEAATKVLSNRYMGIVYDGEIFELAHAYIDNNKNPFYGTSNSMKYRPLAQRAFPTRKKSDSKELLIPSLEIRLGNSIAWLREFVADQIEARLGSGDYRGLRSVLDYNLYSNAKPNLLLSRTYRVGQAEVKQSHRQLLTAFFKKLLYQEFPSKLLAPFLNWEMAFRPRLSRQLLQTERLKYLEALVALARRHRNIKSLDKLTTLEQFTLTNELATEISPAYHEFARAVGLSQKYVDYLTPPSNSNQ